MNFLLKRIFRKYIPPEREAAFLVKVAAGSAYQVFLDDRFRALIRFGQHSEEEQNRIFNELVVTGLVLLALLINDSYDEIIPERKEFWRSVREEVPLRFTGWLSEIGIAAEFAQIWKKLIQLRLEEYQADQIQTRHAWIEEMFRDQDRNDEALNDAAVRIETLVVGSLLHLTRGAAKPDDPLRKHLRTWLCVLDRKLAFRVGW